MNRNSRRRPARPPYAYAKAEPTLLQFVLLSMLLHVLLVLLFGNTLQGGARRGDGMLGPLDVTLRQLSPERGSGFTLAPGADTNFPGAALLRRLEGAVRPPRESAEGAAPQPPANIAPVESAPVPKAASEVVPDVSLSPQPTPAEALPRLDRSAPQEVDRAVTPQTTSPPKAEKEIAPPAPLPPREVPMPPMAPLERVAPVQIEQQFAPPVELRQREVPMAPIAPIEKIAPQRIERQLAPSVELKPREEPAQRAAPVESPAPTKIEREVVPPAEVRPRDIPLPPVAPMERIAPAKIERQFAPPVELPQPKAPVEAVAPARAAPPTTVREAAPAPQALPRNEAVELAPARERAAPATAAPGRAAPAQAPARTEAPTGGELPRLRLGAPDVDAEIFTPKRDAGATSSEAASAPGVTAEKLRSRGREIAKEGSGSRAVLNLLPPPPPVEKKDHLAEDIAKAAKPDCRTAYAGLGLLAVAPLAVSTFGNGGCRW